MIFLDAVVAEVVRPGIVFIAFGAAPVAVAGRVTLDSELNHETGDYTIESRPIIEFLPHQFMEPVRAAGSPCACHFNGERPFGCFERYLECLRCVLGRRFHLFCGRLAATRDKEERQEGGENCRSHQSDDALCAREMSR